MTTAEGRARMLAQAKPLWSALPEGALQKQLLSELAVKGNLPLADLQSLWRTSSRPRRAERPASQDDDGGPWHDAPPDLDEANSAQSGADGFHAPDGERSRGKGRDFQGGKSGGFRSNRPMNPKWAAIAKQEAEVEAQRRQPRAAPQRTDSRVVQILFGHAEFWDQLSADEHTVLHELREPWGPLLAWLERDLTEHGPRPWAVLSHALRDDPALGEDALALANGDADPAATFEDFRRAMDVLLDRELGARKEALVARIPVDPSAIPLFREVDRHWKEVKARLAVSASQD